jgi:hypothetical protein
MIGATVGSYQVREEIGHGGMGVVYVAEHPLIGSKVAVKVLLPEYSLTRPTQIGGIGTPYRVAIVDITRDDKPDVVVASMPQPIVPPGNGDGTLGAPVVGPLVAATGLAIGDFDGDGNADVAVCGGNDQLHILTVIASYTSRNNGASYSRVGAADFNGDNKPDLFADDDGGGVATFLNPGGTMFTFSGTPPISNFGTRIDDTAFDADGDGKPDLVLLQPNMGSASGQYQVTVGHYVSSNEGFVTNTSSTGLPGATAIAAGDFDGDGNVDAAVADQVTTGSNAVYVVSGTGSALVYTATFKVPSGGPSSIAVGDLDGDGRPDIVVGLAAGGVGVLMNKTTKYSSRRRRRASRVRREERGQLARDRVRLFDARGVPGARDDDEPRACNRLRRLAPAIEDDRAIVLAVQHLRRRGDAPKLVGDRPPPDDRVERRVEPRRIERQQLAAHFFAQRRARAVVEKRAPEHDLHDRADERAHAQRARDQRHGAILRHVPARLAVGSALDERERAQELRPTGGQPQADEAAHRQADEVARRSAELLDQRRRVGGQPLQVVRRRRRGAAPLAAMIVGDAAKARRQRRDLRVEHRARPQKAVREDDRRPPAALLVVQLDSVDREHGHAAEPSAIRSA